MLADGFYIPKANPRKPLREDSYFINKESQVIGVADGVGSWSKKGIDAGKYARELMRNAATAVDEVGIRDPKRVLLKAFLKTEARGSLTACIIALAEGNLVRAANLGDSGFLVIRKGKTVYRSSVQLDGFNCPYQIGKYSTNTRPEKADEIEVPVEDGDVIIVGTDGLFGNVFQEDIELFVGLCIAKRFPPDLLALHLAITARKKSLERKTVSPFQVAARQAGVTHFGGKHDDITVVATYICPAESHEDIKASKIKSTVAEGLESITAVFKDKERNEIHIGNGLHLDIQRSLGLNS